MPTYGEYPDMFTNGCCLAEDRCTDVHHLECGGRESCRDSVEAADGFLITGSKSSVYDDKALDPGAWKTSCVSATPRGAKSLVSALVTSWLRRLSVEWWPNRPKGWGVGVHCYTVDRERL